MMVTPPHVKCVINLMKEPLNLRKNKPKFLLTTTNIVVIIGGQKPASLSLKLVGAYSPYL
jgi:hypothetical protein